MTDWIRVVSWHVLSEHSQLLTLCGLKVRAHPEQGEHQAQGWAVELPPNQKSCESCLRALARRRPDEQIGEGQE